jgi:hypothetical protein
MPVSRPGGLKRGPLFDTNVPATEIDKDIFTDQEVEDTVSGDDLILMLDVSETPDRVKYMTRADFVAGLMGDYIQITDNESTNENDLIPFVANAATSTGSQSLEMDGDFHYNPSTGRITATQLAGTLQTASQTNITGVGTVTTGTWEATDVGVAHGGTGASTLNNLITMGTHTTGNYIATITAGTGLTSDGATSGEGITHSLSVDASQSQITTVGALNAGSITSGFTSIDVGSGAITTTGALSIASMGTNWTNAGRTVADMGTVTTIDINGGTINGITDLAVADGGTGASTLDNLITLTTHTTGNYVATVTGGVGIVSSGATSGEGIIHSLSIDLAEVGEIAIADGDYIAFMDATDSNATKKEAIADVATLFAGTGLTASSSVLGVDASQTQITSLGTIGTGTWEATDVGVAHGGTGASSLTDGGILLGSGTGAITAMAVLADGEMIVGDGTTDPVAESGSTLRTSIGVAIGSDVQAYDAELAAIAGLTSAANKIPMFSGSESASLLDFKDEDTLGSDSATAVASQQSIKAYVDASNPDGASAFSIKMALAL